MSWKRFIAPTLAAGLATASLAAAQQAGEHAHASVEGFCLTYSIPAVGPPPPPAQHFVGAGLVITPTFDANVTAAQRACIQEAIDEWEEVFEGAGTITNPFPITFKNGPLGAGTAALAGTSYNTGTGAPISGSITFDNDGSTSWWVDPTPQSDSEFDAEGFCREVGGSPGPCDAGIDYLFAARHEIGHTLGWTGGNPLIAAQMSEDIFDPARLNIATASGDASHSSPTQYPRDLMNPSAPGGERRSIEMYPTASFPARGLGHDTSFGFIDEGNFGGTLLGTADDPWPTVGFALQQEPPDTSFVIIPGDYNGTATPFTITGSRRLVVADGGSAVIR